MQEQSGEPRRKLNNYFSMFTFSYLGFIDHW